MYIIAYNFNIYSSFFSRKGLLVFLIAWRSARRICTECQAGNRTQACLTASQTCQYNTYVVRSWATLHPSDQRCTLLSYPAPSDLRCSLLSYAAPNWATLPPTDLCWTHTELQYTGTGIKRFRCRNQLWYRYKVSIRYRTERTMPKCQCRKIDDNAQLWLILFLTRIMPQDLSVLVPRSDLSLNDRKRRWSL